METTRQKKFAAVLQKDLTMVLQKLLKETNKLGTLVSVTKVKVSPDLSCAKAYVSVFPVKNTKIILELLRNKKGSIRNSISALIKNQVRKIPQFTFSIDDSLEQISLIEKALEGVDNPIKKNFTQDF